MFKLDVALHRKLAEHFKLSMDLSDIPVCIKFRGSEEVARYPPQGESILKKRVWDKVRHIWDNASTLDRLLENLVKVLQSNSKRVSCWKEGRLA